MFKHGKVELYPEKTIMIKSTLHYSENVMVKVMLQHTQIV